MKKMLLALVVVFAQACGAVRQLPPVVIPPPGGTPDDVVAAIQANCSALWTDELQRPITLDELMDCTLQITDRGVTIEDWRLHLRATPEYAALHALAVSALHVDGARLVKQDGSLFVWKGLTAFRLAEMVATGREAEAEAFLGWAKTQDVTIVRVLAMAQHLFQLEPAAGRAAMPRVLELARREGIAVEIVALADTGSYEFDHRGHVQEIGAMCAAVPGCVLEIGNEVLPVHQTQDGRLGDIEYLKELRRLVPAVLPVSLGSTHAGEDESDALADGDYLTIHGSREDGDEGWRWIRHTNEQRAVSERTRRYAVNDEPKRDDLSADKQMAIAVLCRMFGLGDTFHYAGGLQAQIATAAESAALEARRRGWAAIPADWTGRYYNTGMVGSPVKSFAGAVRVYSSVNGGIGYTLVLGADGERIDWNDDFPIRTLLLSDGGMRLYRVERANARIGVFTR